MADSSKVDLTAAREALAKARLSPSSPWVEVALGLFGDALLEIERLRALLEERPMVPRCTDTNCGCQCVLELGHRGSCYWRSKETR